MRDNRKGKDRCTLGFIVTATAVAIALSFSFFLSLSLFSRVGVASTVEEGSLGVEVPPDWRSGHLAVYPWVFPGEGSELRGSVSVVLAVWNADPGEPVRILLDGEEAALITREGVFRYNWELRGSHHLAVVCRYRIFREASFWVRPPPPKPPTIRVEEFRRRLEEQREQMILAMVGATALGVPTGIWTKKKTRVGSAWALTLPGLVSGLGLWRMPTLYMLIPYGIAWALSYWLCREYADYLAVTVIEEGMIDTVTMPMDERDMMIDEISPRHWRHGFIKTKHVDLRNNRYPVLFRFMGSVMECITVNGRENIEETENRIEVECSPELGRALTESRSIKWLQRELSEQKYKAIFTERALPGLVSHVVSTIEQTARDRELDKIKTIQEAVEKVKQAQQDMKQLLGEQEQSQTQKQRQKQKQGMGGSKVKGKKKRRDPSPVQGQRTEAEEAEGGGGVRGEQW